MNLEKYKVGKKGKSLKELGQYTRNLSLDMTEGCSLRCKYCFADFASEKRENRVLTEEVMKAAVDWLFDDNTSGTVDEVNKSGGLGFEPWGGEPLHNWEMIKKSYEYFLKKSNETGKKVRHIGGTTNGVEFTEEKLKWLKDRNITWLISLDGIKENHDSQRVFPSGVGSFDVIDKNIDLYKKVFGYAPQVRMSLHPDYIKNLYKSYEYILGKGIKSYFFSPVFEANWTEDHYRELENQLVMLYEKLVLDYKNGFPKVDNKFIDEMIYYILTAKKMGVDLEKIEQTGEYNKELNRLSRGMSLPKPCGAGTSYFGVSVEGQIFVCHRFNKHGLNIKKNPFDKRTGWMGNVWEGIHNKELFATLDTWDVKDLKHCEKCKLKYYCKGSCYASNYDNVGDIKGQNKKSCDVNNALYNAAIKIIDIFKQHGMYDFKNHEIIYNQNNRNQNSFKGKHGQNIDKCMCNNATYYVRGIEELLSDETPENREDLKMQILDGGINVLLDMYQEIKENKLHKNPNKKTQNARKKIDFNPNMPNN